MPRPPSPPPDNEEGANLNPRQLNRWLDVNPVYALTRTETFWKLPTFSVQSDWKGYSEIVAVFNYTSLRNFALKPNFTVPLNPNFVACVMWVDANYNVFRYRLWQNVGEVFYFPAPLYQGQLVKKNFRIEIWSTATDIDLSVITVTGAGTAAANGNYAQVSSTIWGDLFGYNIFSLTGGAFSGNAGINDVITGKYVTQSGGIFGFWSLQAGAAPVPVVTAKVTASLDDELTLYTSVRGNFDYMWREDSILANNSTIVTDFAWPLVAGSFPLPFVWPANSFPTINT
jgi:hypothetical protein